MRAAELGGWLGMSGMKVWGSPDWRAGASAVLGASTLAPAFSSLFFINTGFLMDVEVGKVWMLEGFHNDGYPTSAEEWFFSIALLSGSCAVAGVA